MGRENIKVYCATNCIISSLGVGTQQNYDAVCSYTTNVGAYEDGRTPVCRIDRSVLGEARLEGYTFAEQLSIAALSDVVKRSNVALSDPKTLLILSTTKGNIECLNTDVERCYLWKMADTIAAFMECANKPLVISNACISGVAAIVVGSRLIRQGEYDLVYVVGVDVVSEFVVSGFNSFKSISQEVCRPYDISRDGLTLGEGCAALLLTNNGALSDSKVVIAGGAMSNDANHISAPSRSGDGLFYAMEASLQQAGIDACEVGFVNAHGTGTRYNDEMESKALQMAAMTSVACNSLKPYLGHTLGASGVIETILAVEQLTRNCVVGVKGYATNGVPFALNVTASHREMPLSHCLKTASGFGGTNAALLLSKEDALPAVPINEEKDIAVVKASSIEINKQEGVLFADYIRSEYKALGETNMKFYKMDNLAKLAYIASSKLLREEEVPYPPNRIGVVMANRSASLDTDCAHQKIVDQHLPEGSSPAVFVYTLANIMAAEVAIKHTLQGELTLFINEDKSSTFVEKYAIQLIKDGVCDAVVCGWCELFKEDYNADLTVYKRE